MRPLFLRPIARLFCVFAGILLFLIVSAAFEQNLRPPSTNRVCSLKRVATSNPRKMGCIGDIFRIADAAKRIPLLHPDFRLPPAPRWR
ncbi:MAG TPA: hypothetical protein DDZ68_04135 [Parvularcula sp.]|nr:hypothetical protein [Parvularcula sp.]HBS32012.1 hypothetical protein [Parvularcula sp.]HBS35454.1 hypothetical protein [Parvularcula sp.]